MKKFVFFLTALSIALFSHAQVYQLTWSNGEVLYGIALDEFDSVSYVFGEDMDMSRIHILNRHNINRVVRDTMYITKYIYDTIYAAPPIKSIGVFSVSSNRKVTFSPGNLQYQASSKTWRFAPSQTDYIGDGNESISSYYSGWIDLFGWGTGSNPTKSSTYSSDYSTFVDWGSNKIGNDAPYTWRTLTKEEWYYMRYTRYNASSLCGVAKVAGVNGLIFLPDNWICPSCVTFKSGFHSNYSVEAYGYYQTFTSEQWSKMEQAGAVFLPVGGRRNGTSVDHVQYCARYWSSTPDGSYDAYYLYFYSDEAPIGSDDRSYGRNVRLVKDL
jgi:hypothetical protein